MLNNVNDVVIFFKGCSNNNHFILSLSCIFHHLQSEGNCNAIVINDYIYALSPFFRKKGISLSEQNDIEEVLLSIIDIMNDTFSKESKCNKTIIISP
jgi:hypothetical protein